MRNVFIVVATCAALFVAGCVPSFHPLYTEDDLIFDPALVGAWGGDDLWIFEKSGELEYRLTIANNDDPVPFEARLLQLGAHRFLDLYPYAPEPVEHFFPSLIPTHTFFRLEMEGDDLRIVSLDPSWLEDRIEAGEIEIDHAFANLPAPGIPDSWDKPDPTLVLTAPTEDLQALVVKYADDPEAFRTSGPNAAAWELKRR